MVSQAKFFKGMEPLKLPEQTRKCIECKVFTTDALLYSSRGPHFRWCGRQEKEWEMGKTTLRCTCGPHTEFSDLCFARAGWQSDGSYAEHPIANLKPATPVTCLRCHADWPAGKTHICMDYRERQAKRQLHALNYGSNGDPILKPATEMSNIIRNCPTCNRPLLSRGDEAGVDPASDTAFAEIVEEFLKVNHLESVQEKVERLQRKFRFVKRALPAEPDRED